METRLGRFLLPILAVAAYAQPPSIADQEAARARLLLHSTRLADKAWGAYFAGRLHSPDLAADLIEEFRASTGTAASSHAGEDYAYVAALFDAAIEGGIQIPAAVLQPFEEIWSDPVLILLAVSQDRERQDFLLRMSDARPDLVWLAANNLLFGMKSRKWYSKTLSDVTITQRFTVIDPDSAPPGDNGMGVGGSCGDGMIAVPNGFPSIAFYSLESTPQPGMVLLAPGPENVYYRRTRVAAGKPGGFGSCSSVDRAQTRIGYLAALARVQPAEVDSLFQRKTLIQYRGPEEFQREIQQDLQTQEQGIRRLLQTIQERERLTGSGVGLRIVPEVNDQRRNRTDPLPAPAAREIVLN